MLTRLKVSGFKNLFDVDVRFGPFTCIAAVNGVGKSNRFDAIRFLSALLRHGWGRPRRRRYEEFRGAQWAALESRLQLGRPAKAGTPTF